MALNANNKILANDFIELKRRVKNEMARRKGQDSLTSYAGAAYDYTIVPAEGIVTKTEHVNKIITPLNAIAPTGENLKTPGDIMKNIKNLETKLDGHATMSEAQGAASDCNGGCNGLCFSGCFSGCSNTCTGGCSGCTGSCTGSCSGCTGDCEGKCTGCGSGCADECDGCDNCSGCGSGCADECDGCDNCTGCGSGCADTCEGCVGGCWHDGCTSNCTAACRMDCEGGCKGECGSGCAGECTGGAYSQLN